MSDDFDEVGFLHEFFGSLSADFADIDDYLESLFGADTPRVNSQSPIEDYVIPSENLSGDISMNDHTQLLASPHGMHHLDWITTTGYELDDSALALPLSHSDIVNLGGAEDHDYQMVEHLLIGNTHDLSRVGEIENDENMGADDQGDFIANPEIDPLNPDVDFFSVGVIDSPGR